MDWNNLFSGFAGAGALAFLQLIGRELLRPKLRLSFASDDACIAETETSDLSTGRPVGKAKFVRIKVENSGWTLARECRAYLVRVEKQGEGGVFGPTIYSDSIPLQWSCRELKVGGEPIDLPRGVSQYVDVIATYSNTKGSRAQFSGNYRVNRYDSLVSLPGVYRCTVLVSGNGVGPTTLSIDVDLRREWDQVAATYSPS